MPNHNYYERWVVLRSEIRLEREGTVRGRGSADYFRGLLLDTAMLGTLARGARLGPRLSMFFMPNTKFPTLQLLAVRGPQTSAFSRNFTFPGSAATRLFSTSHSSFSGTPSPGHASKAAQVGVNEFPTPTRGGGGFAKLPRVISSKSVGYWLLFCGATVFGIVVLGGLTRLTESGLSITEWKPLTGVMPPVTDEDWEREFALYRDSPEFQQLNSNMTVEEYKFIYYMEWAHRLWGRAIGLLVLGPGLYFVLRGRTAPATNRQLLGISLLLGLQGVIGWWMVHSGLDRENLDARADTQPRVSHYRLATHLTAAFLLYFAMTLTGLSILKQNRYLKNPVQGNQEIAVLSSALATWPRRFAFGLLGLGLLTAVSGSFVAGLDAGLLYNSFPMMGRGLTPSTNELFDKRYTGESDPSTFSLITRNALDNPVTVQLIHRVLAVTTWTACLGFFLYARKRKALLPRSVFKGAHGVLGFASLQAGLGIATLIYVVPLPLAALHQSGAMLFLTSILVLINRLRVPKGQIRRVIRLMAEKLNPKVVKDHQA